MNRDSADIVGLVGWRQRAVVDFGSLRVIWRDSGTEGVLGVAFGRLERGIGERVEVLG